jgi:hypothetical protein
VLATDGDQSPPVNFQAGMQQPGILQPAEPDSLSIGHRRFTELEASVPNILSIKSFRNYSEMF